MGQTYNVVVERRPVVPWTKVSEANQPVDIGSVTMNLLSIILSDAGIGMLTEYS